MANSTGSGYIPILISEGENIPEAWEKACLLTWQKGIEIATEYDKPGDPPSRDATMIMVVRNPMAEPRISRAFPGGLEELEIYRHEVVYGVHDHWINPAEGKWTYTYHKRLFAYEMEGKVIDQINYIVQKLSSSPFSRRGQAITWNPSLDPETDDPPCLQRIFCRLVQTEGKYFLNMNTHWRSRDAWKASFMNIFALTSLQEMIAGEISKKTGMPVVCGRYVDISDSFHIYGSYYRDFEKFLNTLKARNFAERTWTMEFAEPFFEEGRKRLEKEKA